jgi:hypothetical protein
LQSLSRKVSSLTSGRRCLAKRRQVLAQDPITDKAGVLSVAQLRQWIRNANESFRASHAHIVLDFDAANDLVHLRSCSLRENVVGPIAVCTCIATGIALSNANNDLLPRRMESQPGRKPQRDRTYDTEFNQTASGQSLFPMLGPGGNANDETW